MTESKFLQYFSVIQDFRQEGKVLHNLIDILFIAVASVIAGADDWNIVVTFANSREEWFRKFLELPNGIPSKDTFRRVFALIEPKQFEKCFVSWVKEIAQNLEDSGAIVAIDGKTLCGAKRTAESASAIHIVSAWTNQNKLTLGQVKVNEKSNEITAIPELLDLLFIKGNIVTIDAMGCQKNIAKKIIEDNKADYVLALKGNHELLCNDVKDYFESLLKNEFKDIAHKSITTKEKSHGRIEIREYHLVTEIDWLSDRELWTGLKAIGMVKSKCEHKGKISTETRYYIASIANVEKFAEAVRTHWGIESMHWTLDVTFNEDRSRIRINSEPENMAMIRKMALNIVRMDKNEEDNPKMPKSVKAKRFLSAIDVDYLEKLLIKNLV